RHPGRVRFCQDFLLNQIAPFEDAVLKRACENTDIDARKANLEPRAVGFHLTCARVITSGRALNFVGISREAGLVGDAGSRRWIASTSPGRGYAEIKRRIPERFPAKAVHDLRCQLDAQTP